MGATPVSDAAACVSVPRLSFFFFFPQIRFDLARFTPTWLLFSPIHAELGQFGQNQAVSAESGRIGQPYWPAIETANIG